MRNNGHQDSFTQSQLEKSLDLVAQMTPDAQKTALAQLVIAYEPVWAIGTGLVPALEEIDLIHQFIKTLLKDTTNPSKETTVLTDI